MADKAIEKDARDLSVLLDATNIDKPKPKDVQALRQYLSEHRDAWRAVGDLLLQAQLGIVDATNGKPSLKESMKAGLQKMPKELARPGDTELERILIDQVVLAWLRLGIAEYYYTERLKGEYTFKAAEYWERRLTQTQARYTRAIEALARVRRLNRPGQVQVNIAQQQTNIAQNAPSASKRIAPGPETKEVNPNDQAQEEKP